MARRNSTNPDSGAWTLRKRARPGPGFVNAWTTPGGTPHVVNREQVTLVREEWRVVDRWWTDEPVDRHYFEVVLEGGRNVCVYRDAEKLCWFTQNA